MFIDYTELSYCSNYIYTVNHAKLEDVILNIDGKNFCFSNELIEFWKFVGLNLKDLILMIDDETYDVTFEDENGVETRYKLIEKQDI